jgi:MerR family transcriptional regulator, redox-sensitive transcriptional activator SoxR
METLAIGDFAARAGVAPSALRYYEREGLIRSARTPGNQRRYERAELRRVAFIKIAQQVGVTLDEIRDALSELPEGRTPTKTDWARLSARWRHRLDERITLMERLRDQLTGCIGCGCLSLQRCKLINPADRLAVRGTGPQMILNPPAEPGRADQ